MPSDICYFLVYGYLTTPLQLRNYIVSNSIMIVNTEWQRMWKRAIMGYLRHCSGIFIERLRKTMRNRSEDGPLSGQDLKREPSEYEKGLLTIAL